MTPVRVYNPFLDCLKLSSKLHVNLKSFFYILVKLIMLLQLIIFHDKKFTLIYFSQNTVNIEKSFGHQATNEHFSNSYLLLSILSMYN